MSTVETYPVIDVGLVHYAEVSQVAGSPLLFSHSVHITNGASTKAGCVYEERRRNSNEHTVKNGSLL